MPIDETRERPEPRGSDVSGDWWRAFSVIVESRRAIRHFSSEPVATHDMHDVRDSAVLAPTSSNLQPYELCWVRTPEARSRLVRACMSQPAARTAAELVVCIARWDRSDDTRREIAAWLRSLPHVDRAATFYYDHLAQWTYDQGPLGLWGRLRGMLVRPVLLAVPLPRGPASRQDVRVWAIKSAALACENLILAARAKGLDSCPMEGADAVRVGRIPGLDPSRLRKTRDLTMVIAVGHRSPAAALTPRWRRRRSALVREIDRRE